MVRVVNDLRSPRGKPSEVVVLLPFAQLLGPARKLWPEIAGDGFAPRFETTRTWADRLAPFVPQGLDLSLQPARDLIIAQQLMRTAGLTAAVPAAALVEAAGELARLAAAVAPQERAAWLAHARAHLPLLPDTPQSVESAIARLALEWVGESRLATDVLWQALQSGRVSRVFVLVGLQPDPLAQAWASRCPDRIHFIDLLEALRVDTASNGGLPSHGGGIHLHEAADTEDEAQRAAACVLRHLAAARRPVALATTDRVLSRRVQAMLLESGVAVRDETGWRLSTTRAAATLMRTLELWSPDPSTDAVMDWLKTVVLQGGRSADAGAVTALEVQARRAGVPRWSKLVARFQPTGMPAGGVERMAHDSPALAQPTSASLALLQRVQTWRALGQGRRSLPEWMACLRVVLEESGLWSGLMDDAAGQQVLSALGLNTPAGAAPLADLNELPEARRSMSWSRLSMWTRAVLEGAGFKPAAPEHAEVLLLPLAQFTGRDLAAAVLPGCDELHLPQVPSPTGPWTRAQRQALGLPDAQVLQRAQALAWRDALDTPWVDILWRRKDTLGNPLAASGLVQRLQLAGMNRGDDPRAIRTERVDLRSGAAARAPSRVPSRLSATGYGDLRACPYRFFGLHMLSLRNADEIDTQVDKRDFGAWLHLVLHMFHQRLEQAHGERSDGAVSPHERALLDQAAEDARVRLGLSQAEFLSYLAAWPDLRERYLAWWSGERARGARFVAGEVAHEVSVQRSGAAVVLHGRIDRIDRIGAPHETLRLIDYKTEADSRTRERIRNPLEDTQMAFYAALVQPTGDRDWQDAASVEGGYLQLGERSDPKWFAQTQLREARDALLQGVVRDLDAIAAGAALEALGAGEACAHCSARGLCRKDHWQ